MSTRIARFLAVACIAGCTGTATPTPAATPAPTPSPESAQTTPAAGRGAGRGGGRGGAAGAEAAGPQPYGRVIPASAQTHRGLFITHRVGDKLFFEIPTHELGKDMLIVGRFDAPRRRRRRPGGGGGGGFRRLRAATSSMERALHWDREGNHVVLRIISFDITADSSLSVYSAGGGRRTTGRIVDDVQRRELTAPTARR